MKRVHRMSTHLLLVALLAWASSAYAAIAFVQATAQMDQPNGSTITSSAFPANPKVGNTIVVVAWTWASATTVPIPTISDSAGNAYTIIVQGVTGPNGGYEGVVIYTAPIKTTGANFKITLTLPTGGSQINGIAMEYSGLGAVDRTNSNSGTTKTASIATTAATSNANELVVTVFSLLAPAANYSSITPTAGYTQRAVQLVNNGDDAGSEADKLVSSVGVQSNTWTGDSAFAEWVTAIATFTTASAAPDHYAIAHAGTAVNCEPAAVTITAHNASHAALATTDSITLGTSTSHGDWSLTTGTGSLVAGASNSGAATYTFTASDNGVVVLALRDTYPEALSVNVIDGLISEKSGSALASEDNLLTFVSSGFRITNGSNVATTIGTRIAGLSSASGSGAQLLALQAVRTDTNTGACTTAFASGTTVNVSLAYQCNNPTSCVVGQTMSITNNGTTTNLASNPASGISSYTTVPLRFSTANGEAPFSINYSDAGQITLQARYSIPLGSGAGSGNLMLGSGQFVVQPANLTLANIKCTSYTVGNCSLSLASPGNNPAAATATGTVFMPAGASFTTTVTATNALGAVTPNFGQETAPASVVLTPALSLPASGHLPAVTGNFGSYASGVATGSSFAWPEVGIVKLTPTVSSYLGSGTVTGTTTGNVGRFVPSSFSVALNTPVFGTGCSAGSYSYIGQPLTFTVAPVLTATALAVGGATAQNYTGAFMRLSNTSLTGRTYTPTPASPALDTSGLPATTADPAITDLGSGQAALSFSAGTGLKYARGAATAPFNANIALSINVIDLDGAAASNPVSFGSGSGIAFSTGASQRYGRLALRNAVGSELLDLPVRLVTEYYVSAAQGFAINTGDSCTVAPPIAFSAYQGSLASGETCVRDSGSPGVSTAGCAAPAAAGLRYRATPLAGDFNLTLAAPGAGNSGALTITATAPVWLRYDWDTSSAGFENPTGLASFGQFPGPASRIYQREIY
jgi:MSHA biogenesis protein MshQ